jgi:hypothetical protein
MIKDDYECGDYFAEDKFNVVLEQARLFVKTTSK